VISSELLCLVNETSKADGSGQHHPYKLQSEHVTGNGARVRMPLPVLYKCSIVRFCSPPSRASAGL